MSKEIIDLENFGGMPVINGIQIKTLEFGLNSLDKALGKFKTRLVSTIVNHYSSGAKISVIHKEDNMKFFTDTISCWLGELKVDFTISVTSSHMTVVKAKVVA